MYFLSAHKGEEMLNLDYERARRRAMLNRLKSVILRRPSSLVSLAEAKRGHALAGQVYGGVRQVCVDRIVGSVGRSREFDRNFNPLTDSTRERWARVNQAFLHDVVLPPVELQKVGDSYFVKDGHHRVSVAKYHGIAYIDAEVSEYLFADEAAV
jgi:hypothetical protein